MSEEEKKEKRRFGISGSVFSALMVVAVAAVWLGSGYLRDSQNDEPATASLKPIAKSSLPKVQTRLSIAQARQPKIVIRGGIIEAERSVTVRAEIGGKVRFTSTEKEGNFVRKGDLLCGISIDNRQAEKEEAQRTMELRNLQLRSAKKLSKQGYSTQISLAQARANYSTAKSRLERAKLALKHTSILAPFDGILEKVFLDVGDFASTGTACAKVIDMEPLVVSGNITEDEVVKIKPDESGSIVLPDGSKLKGIVRYIAHSADAKTKTYRIELEAQAPNNDSKLAVREGITVQIHIPLKSVYAHSIPPSILTLNAQGKIGLRLVVRKNNKNIVQFVPIEIIEGNTEEYWVKGLPPEARLIIVGQEYVSDGTEVAVDSSNQRSETPKARNK